MGDGSGIEWTDATWNPVTGCTKVSPGCDHCYAETIAHRFAATKAYPNAFDVTLRPERLDQPLRWRRPRRVFVNSMSDLFHKDIPDEYIAKVFASMALADRHTFQVLTKRPGRMRSLLSSPGFSVLLWAEMVEIDGDFGQRDWPLPNVWLGVSVEDQKWADVRIPNLAATPAAVRFISAEPLLGPIDLRNHFDHRSHDTDDVNGHPHMRSCMTCAIADDDNIPAYWRAGIDWVIVGGESGTGARPMHPDWARSLRDQCVSAAVPFLFKQWGNWRPLAGNECAKIGDEWPTGTWAGMSRNVGKKAAGRELDGRTWDEYPASVA